MRDTLDTEIRLYKNFRENVIEIGLIAPSLMGRIRRVIVIYPRERYIWYYKQELETPENRRETITEKVVSPENLESLIRKAIEVEDYADFLLLAEHVKNAY